MINIIIPSSSTSYSIHFLDQFDALQKKLLEQIANRKALFITDANVYEKTEFFREFFIPKENILVLTPGEEHKNWKNVERIIKFGFEQHADRSSVFVAVGGGVIGDMVGFASSIYMRGVPCIQVPTTLLSMVDSSVGGKTGCDTSFGKNLIGAFTQPEAVFCTRQFLETLKLIEIQNGMSEMIKHAIISSPSHFDDLKNIAEHHHEYFVLENPNETCSKKILNNLFTIVPDSINIKKEVVEADEKEQGVRGHLNLGHTYGHAIELLSNFSIPHGIAVAKGIYLAFQESKRRGILDDTGSMRRTYDFFHLTGVPLRIDFDEEDIKKAMTHDKKKKDGKIRLILPHSIGSVEYYDL